MTYFKSAHYIIKLIVNKIHHSACFQDSVTTVDNKLAYVLILNLFKNVKMLYISILFSKQSRLDLFYFLND